MSQNKKKPVQYFFVDINDPDYYKRIKVARACIDCRKRKSKCDIGIPGSGACSSCRKHNKICEFTATTATILSSSVQTIVSSPAASSSSSAQPCVKRKKIQRSVVVSDEKILPSSSFQAESEFHWPPQQLTLIPFMVPEGASYYNHTTTTDASQFTVTQEDNHLVGHLRFDLPVRFEQQQQVKNLSIVPLLPITPPLSSSSHSTALSSSSSSTITTPSPSLDTNHACDATFPWKTSKSSDQHPKKENFMRSVSHVDPVKNDYYLFSSSSSCSSYLQQQQQQQQSSSSSPSELDLLNIYFERIHPSYPALSKSILKLRHTTPSCLLYAIMALSLLDYEQQQQQIPTNTLSHDYYTKAWTMIQSRGTSDLVSAQTLLLLYKYHETIKQAKPSLLETTRAILEQQQQETNSSFGDDNDHDEWICRLCWLVYLHQLNTPDTNNTTWNDPPMIRLPCLLPCEEDDPDQAKTISQFLDSIHIACVYASAMQNLAVHVDDDPWSSSSAFGPPPPDDHVDSSIL